MSRILLILGDVLTLGIVSWYGFAFHGTVDAGALHLGSTFVPLVASWLILGFHLGVFRDENFSDWKQLWRPFWAMLLAAPLAGLLRGFWLQRDILPLFVVIIGGISALALTTWRAIFYLVYRWMRSH